MTNAQLLRWRNSVFALFLVNGIVAATWGARLPAVREDTGASLQLMGVAFLGGAIGALTGLSLGPLLMHRVGARRALGLTFGGSFVGLLIAAAGASVFGQLWVVVIGMLVWGLTIAAGDVINNIEAAANEREIGKTLMPLMHGFFSLGTVIGALSGAAAAAVHWPVLLNMVVVIVVGVGLLVWALPGVPERLELDESGEKIPLRERLRETASAWKQPVVILIGIGVLANGMAEGGAGDWIAIGAVDGHGLNQAQGAFLFGIFVTGMTLVRFIGGPAVDRWGRVWVLRISALSALAGIALFIWSNDFALVLIGALLWGAGVAMGFPLGMSAAADDANGPARVSVVSTLGYGAFLIGPPLLGFLGQSWGILPALGILLGLLALAVVVAPAARERRDVPTQPTTQPS